MRRIFIELFGGWMCEYGHYHFLWEKNRCCWDDSTVGIKGWITKTFYCIDICGDLCANDECECLCHNVKAKRLTSNDELACSDYCISDAGTNCIYCERFLNTKFAKEIKCNKLE